MLKFYQLYYIHLHKESLERRGFWNRMDQKHFSEEFAPSVKTKKSVMLECNLVIFLTIPTC